MVKKLAVLFVLLFALPTYAAAEITIDATYGLNGKVKAEEPVRVDVVITNDAGPFEGNLLTTFKESYQLQAARVYPVQLAKGEQMELSFFIENYQENMIYGNEPVPFVLYDGAVADGRVIANVKVTENKPALFNYEAFVVGTYNLDAAYTSLQQMRALSSTEVILEKLVAPQLDARDYALFDVLVIGNELKSFTKEEQTALVQWVEQGGKLVTDTSLAGTAFEQYEPLRFTEGTIIVPTVELNNLAKDGTFADALTVKTAVTEQGATTWPKDGNVLAGKMPVQNGQVIQTAFALADAGLLQTNGYSHLVAQMIDLRAFTWKGYYESNHYQIANQLTTNNELFEAFAFSIWKVIAVLAVYILIVSVILYIILKKKDKREHAWWLIPAISIGFSLGLFVVGAKDRLWKPQLQEMMLWTATESGGTQYFTQSVLANNAGDYMFQLEEGVKAATYHMSGVPTDKNQLSYQDGNQLVLKGIPYWGVKSIVGSAVTATEAGYIEQQLTIKEKQLTGTVTNHFPFALENVQAWIGRDFYDIGDIAPGETMDVNIPIAFNYLMKAIAEESMLYDERNEALPVLRQNSLLNLASNRLGHLDTALLIASAPEATLPSQLKKTAKSQTDVVIAAPLTANMAYKGDVTLATENLELELIQQENYSDWLTADVTEWYFERMPYTLKYHVPKTLTQTAVTWHELVVDNTDERLLLKVLNRETDVYEELRAQADANVYVKDGYVQLELQFVGSEMGDMATLPKLQLKGELK
ncbi:MAG: hypothetical protein ABS948_01690 [Solibacillus sp.]